MENIDHQLDQTAFVLTEMEKEYLEGERTKENLFFELGSLHALNMFTFFQPTSSLLQRLRATYYFRWLFDLTEKYCDNTEEFNIKPIFEENIIPVLKPQLDQVEDLSSLITEWFKKEIEAKWLCEFETEDFQTELLELGKTQEDYQVIVDSMLKLLKEGVGYLEADIQFTLTETTSTISVSL